ncbi:hypothetical protein KKA24_03230 [Patescibacteria group bacterium]|nr:hypothetical protein [Patescibacteria group bacterium]
MRLNFLALLYRIAHNEFVNELKKKKKEPLNFFDPDTIFPHLVSKEEKGIYDIDKEISDILNIPTSTVGIRLKRGIKKLKEIYERNK